MDRFSKIQIRHNQYITIINEAIGTLVQTVTSSQQRLTTAQLIEHLQDRGVNLLVQPLDRDSTTLSIILKNFHYVPKKHVV